MSNFNYNNYYLLLINYYYNNNYKSHNNCCSVGVMELYLLKEGYTKKFFFQSIS